MITDTCTTTILSDALTKAEKKLVEEGEGSTVREIRRKFQEAMADDITALVGRITGRETGTLLSDHHPIDDIAVETVVLMGRIAAE